MSFDRRKYLIEQISSLDFSPDGIRIRIKIAETTVDWITPSEPLANHLRSLFEQFLAPLGFLNESDGQIFAVPHTSQEDPLFVWEDPDPEFDIRGDIVVQRDFVAKRRKNRAEVLLAPEFDDAIHNSLRWFLPPLLLEKYCFLLHGAAVIRDDQGYVFFGQSGAGKSTTVDLIAKSDTDSILIGDDAVIVQVDPVSGKAQVHAAPLGCGYSRFSPPCVSAPLVGLYPLKQDPTHDLDELSVSERVSALLASAMTSTWDYEVEARFNLALFFATATCSFKQLRLKKDAGFWPMVLSDIPTR